MYSNDPKETRAVIVLCSRFNKLSFLFFLIIFLNYGCRKADPLTAKSPQTANASSLSVDPRPNIILILGDDVGYEIPTQDGGKSYATPTLDKMASTGMRFTECRTTPLCSPSRFELLTGKYNFRNYNTWGVMDTTNRTIANVLRDAGYKTCIAGKWQLGGGDPSIHALGFDNYMVWNPFSGEGSESQGRGSRYKDPQIYTDSAFLPEKVTTGKYGDDFFSKFILDFIDSNKTQPFFAYYSVCLVHPPFGPTPNDPEFATWDPAANDTRFFPSMVNYMDQKIGQIIDKVNEDGIAQNTLIIFVGDNGTPDSIFSDFENIESYEGGKGHTRENGIHVPLFAVWPGKIAPGSVNKDLIDLSDFLPTLADVANTSVPTTYGVVDGVSFYPTLLGLPGTPRSWTFCHYSPQTVQRAGYAKRWVQNQTYKLYDSTYRFYNFINDPDEKYPLKTSQLSPKEKKLRRSFLQVLSTEHN